MEISFMTIEQKNREFLSTHFKNIYRSLSQKPIYDIAIEPVQGQLNFLMSNSIARCFCHSLYSIDREFDMMLKSVNQNVETLIIFGLGCGYVLNFAHDKFKNLKRLVIIEPNLGLFKEIIKLIDLEELTKLYPQVHFILNKSYDDTLVELGEIVGMYLYDVMDFAFLVSYRTVFPGFYENIIRNLTEEVRKLRVNINTKQALEEEWTRNIFRNLLEGGIPFEKIIPYLSGRPAVIVSAGPSLDKNIQRLKTIKDKAYIFAVGTSIKVLDSHGIIPDFRVAFDAFESEKMIFQGIDTSQVPLIYNDILHPDILPKYDGHRVKMVMDTDIINPFIYKHLDIEYTAFRSGFSIANTVLDILSKIGCNPIIFVGQDLCYSDGKQYATGGWNRINDIDEEQELIETVDIFGEKVYTKTAFLTMKNLMEEAIKEHQQIQYFNSTEGGLNVEGAINISLMQVDEMLPVTNELLAARNLVIEKLDSFSYSHIIDKNIEAVLALKKQVEQVLELNEREGTKLKYIKSCIDTNNLLKLKKENSDLQKIQSQINNNKLYKLAVEHVLDDIFSVIHYKYQPDMQNQENRNLMLYEELNAKNIQVKIYFEKLLKEIDSVVLENKKQTINVDIIKINAI